MERKESIEKDATSKKTLEQLEEEEKLSTDDSGDSNLPSPDGEFDESKEQTNADPM
jgi:hypothetical protein